MAKHIAYPCLIASFFSSFSGIEAKCAENFPPNPEKDNAIFRQYTTEFDGLQDLSEGDETPSASLDDEWLSSGSMTSSSDSLFSEAGSSSESEGEEPLSQTLGALSPESSPINLPQDYRSILYVEHLQKWVDLVRQEKPQTPEDHKTIFLKSFPDNVQPESIYRVITYTPSKNTHLYAPGLTPTKTPRRSGNKMRLLEGKSPVWVDPRTGHIYRCHMHHLGQIHGHTFIVMLPVDIHHARGFHTHTGSSNIDRNSFAVERRKGRRMLAVELDQENSGIELQTRKRLRKE